MCVSVSNFIFYGVTGGDLVRPVCGGLQALKKPVGGKKMHSVFEGLFTVPM